MAQSYVIRVFNLLFGGLGAISFLEFLKGSDNLMLTLSSIAGSIYFLITAYGKYKGDRIDRAIKEQELKKIKKENEIK